MADRPNQPGTTVFVCFTKPEHDPALREIERLGWIDGALQNQSPNGPKLRFTLDKYLKHRAAYSAAVEGVILGHEQELQAAGFSPECGDYAGVFISSDRRGVLNYTTGNIKTLGQLRAVGFQA